jgi:hypothetical protein
LVRGRDPLSALHMGVSCSHKHRPSSGGDEKPSNIAIATPASPPPNKPKKVVEKKITYNLNPACDKDVVVTVNYCILSHSLSQIAVGDCGVGKSSLIIAITVLFFFLLPSQSAAFQSRFV